MLVDFIEFCQLRLSLFIARRFLLKKKFPTSNGMHLVRRESITLTLAGRIFTYY